MILIGLTGRAGVGKDTVADILQQHYPCARFAFADLLKREICAAFGVDRDLFTRRDLREAPAHELALRYCMDADFVAYAWELSGFNAVKPRTMMQRWGDYRRAKDPAYFIAGADRAYQDANRIGLPLMVVSDVRFPNEAAWLGWNLGRVWRVVRSGLPPVRAHVSEHALDDHGVDTVIRNDGTLDDLQRVVLDLASGLSLKRWPHSKEVA